MASQLRNQSTIIKIVSVCIGLTFVPTILGFALYPVLSGDVIPAFLFILIADISMIVTGTLVFRAHPIVNNKIRLRLSATTIITLLASSITAGVLIDFFVFYIGTGGFDAHFRESYNFTIAFPFFVLLLIIVIHLFRLKNKAIIILSSVVFSVLFMAFTFWFYAKKLGGPPTEFYALIYIIGFVPALIIGLTYGLVIANRLDTRCARGNK